MSTKRPLVILGSARQNSDTRSCVEIVFNNAEADILDLLDYTISPYTYEANYPLNDDFNKITNELLKHETIVFATPVYWYAMSWPMKILFDRFNDLVTIKKETGRKLKGKSVFLIAVGADPELPDGFEIPFKSTAGYLNMSYKASIYFSMKGVQPGREEIKRFKDGVTME